MLPDLIQDKPVHGSADRVNGDKRGEEAASPVKAALVVSSEEAGNDRGAKGPYWKHLPL